MEQSRWGSKQRLAFVTYAYLALSTVRATLGRFPAIYHGSGLGLMSFPFDQTLPGTLVALFSLLPFLLFGHGFATELGEMS
jgi:hypothetical protein